MAQNKVASQQTLDELSTALDSGTFVDVRRMLNGLVPADVAHLLESSPPKFRRILWQMVDIDREGEVLGELGDDLQSQFLEDMDAAEVTLLTEGLEDDDIADILPVSLTATPDTRSRTRPMSAWLTTARIVGRCSETM